MFWYLLTNSCLAMCIFFTFLLHVFHFFRAAILAARSGWGRHFGAAPQPLRTPRRRIPKHLAISLVVDKLICEDTAQEVLTKSVMDAVSWCRTIGINKLTVYKENGILANFLGSQQTIIERSERLLSNCTQGILKSLPIHTEKVYSNNLKSETVYPITPPSSDYSESPPLSPNHKPLCLVPFTAIHVINHTPQKHSEPEKPQELETRCQQRELRILSHIYADVSSQKKLPMFLRLTSFFTVFLENPQNLQLQSLLKLLLESNSPARIAKALMHSNFL